MAYSISESKYRIPDLQESRDSITHEPEDRSISNYERSALHKAALIKTKNNYPPKTQNREEQHPNYRDPKTSLEYKASGEGQGDSFPTFSSAQSLVASARSYR